MNEKIFRLSYLILVPVCFVVLISACAHKPGQDPPVDILYQEAQTFAQQDKVEKAAEAYMKVRTYYPGNELARQSLLELSDLYYKNEEYMSALNSFQEFRMLYPTDPKSDYCQYMIAMCHFKQILTIDRDQTETLKAIRSFEDFLRIYPDSEYAKYAAENLRKTKIALAQNGIYIGKFYMQKKKWHEAACKRFKEIKEGFPGLGLDEELDKLIEQSCGAKK